MGVERTGMDSCGKPAACPADDAFAGKFRIPLGFPSFADRRLRNRLGIRDRNKNRRVGPGMDRNRFGSPGAGGVFPGK